MREDTTRQAPAPPTGPPPRALPVDTDVIPAAGDGCMDGPLGTTPAWIVPYSPGISSMHVEVRCPGREFRGEGACIKAAFAGLVRAYTHS